MLNDLKAVLARQPRIPSQFDLTEFDPLISQSVSYLGSVKATQSMEACPYWPKWNSPWWHMSVLFEMGMADQIPKEAARQLLAEVKATHLPFFFREEAPAAKGPRQNAPCPCSLGNIYQILTAVGLDVDTALPWARGWFLKYQMPDGGLNCDEDAYRADANASSLVGTTSPLEAILCTPGALTEEEKSFLDRGAQCLLGRELRQGSSSTHNAEERLDEEEWLKPCFPRLYFYDVLRGLSFILQWAEALNRPFPASAILEVVRHLARSFPDGNVRKLRLSYEGVGTRLLSSDGEWQRGFPASCFPLMDTTSRLNQVSPFLTRKWQDAVLRIDRLTQAGLIQ